MAFASCSGCAANHLKLQTWSCQVHHDLQTFATSSVLRENVQEQSLFSSNFQPAESAQVLLTKLTKPSLGSAGVSALSEGEQSM